MFFMLYTVGGTETQTNKSPKDTGMAYVTSNVSTTNSENQEQDCNAYKLSAQQ